MCIISVKHLVIERSVQNEPVDFENIAEKGKAMCLVHPENNKAAVSF